MSATAKKDTKAPSSREGTRPKATPTTKGKDAKAPEEPPKEIESPDSKVQQIETSGFGRFEFIDGTIYEGQWKIVNNVKVRHGEGTLKHGGTTGGEAGEEYSGSWSEDKMHGYGTYKYTSGAIYSGEWKEGRQEGKGAYEFPDGSKYEGEWGNHRMHGEGVYTDLDGNKWEGIFVKGVYQSKLQKQLKYERMMKKIESDLMESVTKYFPKFEQTFASSDKKTYKEHLLPFFAIQEEIKALYREPYPKYEERTPDKWNDAMKYVGAAPTTINILRKVENAKYIDPVNILAQQFNGLGQIAEFAREAPERTVKVGLCMVLENTWVLVYFFDTVPAK